MEEFVKTEYFELPSLDLECGEVLSSVRLAFETYGKLNDAKDNAILLCHALTGDAHAGGKHTPNDKKSGWYDEFIGKEKALDTKKYFIICSNILGGCSGSTGPSSINPHTEKPYGLDFPFITVKDMVKAQMELLKHLKINILHSCIGGSLGGMQVLEWSIMYPEMSKSYVIMAAAPYQSSQNIALHEVGRRSIMNDPDWNGGNYYGKRIPGNGLSVARMIAHISYLSDTTMHTKFGRRIQGKDELNFELHNEFEVESYLDYQGRSFIKRFDANSYLYITRAVDYFDYSDEKLIEALSNSNILKERPKYLVISFDSDWLYPSYQSLEIVGALQSAGFPTTYSEVKSIYGHDAFLLEDKKLSPILKDFLAGVV